MLQGSLLLSWLPRGIGTRFQFFKSFAASRSIQPAGSCCSELLLSPGSAAEAASRAANTDNQAAPSAFMTMASFSCCYPRSSERFTLNGIIQGTEESFRRRGKCLGEALTSRKRFRELFLDRTIPHTNPTRERGVDGLPRWRSGYLPDA